MICGRSWRKRGIASASCELIHKIGVTGGKVETRIATAPKEATYLLADVEVVATYKLHNINRAHPRWITNRICDPATARLVERNES